MSIDDLLLEAVPDDADFAMEVMEAVHQYPDTPYAVNYAGRMALLNQARRQDRAGHPPSADLLRFIVIKARTFGDPFDPRPRFKLVAREEAVT